ncbi:hypothetical protein EDB81DRAFT_462890 [Dactylonectria macrodidyma]|uniref:Uncharacterized protein n=1 Tax=Dactylonectria macrodidyma TaxID=307937 RepID=A0A9P9EY78_9HYPO|nr:hypothetical protein EDB81DRAFT_462890 [Dactylonectria macrodidyma]
MAQAVRGTERNERNEHTSQTTDITSQHPEHEVAASRCTGTEALNLLTPSMAFDRPLPRRPLALAAANTATLPTPQDTRRLKGGDFHEVDCRFWPAASPSRLPVMASSLPTAAGEVPSSLLILLPVSDVIQCEFPVAPPSPLFNSSPNSFPLPPLHHSLRRYTHPFVYTSCAIGYLGFFFFGLPRCYAASCLARLPWLPCR